MPEFSQDDRPTLRPGEAPVLRLPSALPPNQGLVAVLEDLLERARSGEVRNMVFASDLEHGSITNAMAVIDDCSMFSLLGNLEWMKFEILRELARREEDSRP